MLEFSWFELITTLRFGQRGIFPPGASLSQDEIIVYFGNNPHLSFSRCSIIYCLLRKLYILSDNKCYNCLSERHTKSVSTSHFYMCRHTGHLPSFIPPHATYTPHTLLLLLNVYHAVLVYSCWHDDMWINGRRFCIRRIFPNVPIIFNWYFMCAKNVTICFIQNNWDDLFLKDIHCSCQAGGISLTSILSTICI